MTLPGALGSEEALGWNVYPVGPPDAVGANARQPVSAAKKFQV